MKTMAKMVKASKRLLKLATRLYEQPGESLRKLEGIEYEFKALAFERGLPAPSTSSPRVDASPVGNPLLDHFEKNLTGPGIFKWRHYLEVYHRHLQRFVGRDVHIVEIGVYSGGSLGMWRSYFGPGARVTGIDIDPVCKVYENDYTRIVIGDQEDRDFWRKFWAETDPVDIVIDDGGHSPGQQVATIEECLPRIRPGGVFICEDFHKPCNQFAMYINGLCLGLQEAHVVEHPASEPRAVDVDVSATPLQSMVDSIHVYPYMAVVEKRGTPFTSLSSVRRGTQWQPIKFASNFAP